MEKDAGWLQVAQRFSSAATQKVHVLSKPTGKAGNPLKN